MTDLALEAIVKIEDVGDRLQVAADVKPRHIGRAITFLYGESGVQVTGTLERVEGAEFLVSGDIYEWTEMTNTRVWRKAIAK